MRQDLDVFLREFGKELQEGNAAVFAGAGLSVPSGTVDWKSLLRDVASEIGLDSGREHDLVRVAQFYVNSQGNNRARLNRILLEQFASGLKPNANHQILASLPISTYWTTNYDHLIEDALRGVGKVADVKYTVHQLLNTVPKRDAVVYKMHGDVDHPDQAILTRNDYEAYHRTRREYLRALTGDLVTKTFLFIGCSFSDPNIEYVLSRLRVEYTEHQRQHFFLLKKPAQNQGETPEEFRYRKTREELSAEDLKRYALKPVWLDDYSEIPTILSELSKRWRRGTVFISGAAHDYSPWGEDAALKFASDLSGSLLREGFRVVSGFGLGIGSAVIEGALRQVYEAGRRVLRDELIVRPFPQIVGNMDREAMRALWTDYRKDMIGQCGISVFLLGNKLEAASQKVVLSAGMREEFDISVSQGVLPVPIGSTGSMAGELWAEVDREFDRFFPNAPAPVRTQFAKMNDLSLPAEKVLPHLMELIKLLRRV